jgi:hypothetical protein
MFDMGVVQGCFDSLKEQIQAIREGGVKAEEPSDDDVKETVAEIGKKGAKPKRAAKATDCEIESLLVKESSAGELVSKLLDRVVQLKLFKLRADENHFRADVQDCIDDFSSLQATIREQAAMLFEADNCKLCSVLEPILVVLRSAIGGGRWHDPPAPSDVREARAKLHKAAKVEKPSLASAEAFFHHDGPKEVMTKCGTLVASSLKDQAANAQFDSAVKQLEEMLEPAFQDVESWVRVGHHGNSIDELCYQSYMKVAGSTLVELQSLLHSWSPSRFAQLHESLEDVVGYLCLIIKLGPLVALRMFLRDVPLIASLRADPADLDGSGMSVTQGPLGSGSPSGGDCGEEPVATGVKLELPPMSAPVLATGCTKSAELGVEQLLLCSTAAQVVLPKLKSHFSSMVVRLKEIGRFLEASVEKFGPAFKRLVDLGPNKVDKLCESLNIIEDIMVAFCDYIHYVGVLLAGPASDYIVWSRLSEFCKAHRHSQMNRGLRKSTSAKSSTVCGKSWTSSLRCLSSPKPTAPRLTISIFLRMF